MNGRGDPAVLFSMTDISLAIFDLDGTLVDAYPAIYRSVNFTLSAFGYPPQSGRVIRRAVGWGDKSLLRPFVKARELDAALAVYRRYHAKALVRGTRLLPGARKVLATLKRRGYKLAVASNRPTRFSRIIMEHCGISGYFDRVLCGDKVARGKPDPMILREIMARLKVVPARAVYVGDMFLDIQTARRAGTAAIAVSTGSSTRVELRREKPDLLLGGVTEILPYLPGN